MYGNIPQFYGNKVFEIPKFRENNTLKRKKIVFKKDQGRENLTLQIFSISARSKVCVISLCVKIDQIYVLLEF